MGSYSSLKLGPLEISWGKNDGFPSYNDLFLPSDLRTVPDRYLDPSEPPRLIEEMARPLRNMVERLELMGHTMEFARAEHDSPTPFGDHKPLGLPFDDVVAMIKSVPISAVTGDIPDKRPLGKFMSPELQQRVIEERYLRDFVTSDHWDLDTLIENLSPYSALRVFAENPANLDLEVIWDFHEVVSNGWVARELVKGGAEGSEILIVTEGSSDAQIIKHALALLRPNVQDFFRFVDMNEGYPFTGTGNLFNFVKGLISIGVANSMLVVFDNDVEGVFNMNRCLALNVPANMRIVRLPDLDAFRSFPTLGPNGTHAADINGRAASIECYLDTGSGAQVRWTSFHEGHGQYQGSLIAKDRYKRRFLDQRELADGYDYSKIQRVLDLVVAECTGMRQGMMKLPVYPENDEEEE